MAACGDFDIEIRHGLEKKVCDNHNDEHRFLFIDLFFYSLNCVSFITYIIAHQTCCCHTNRNRNRNRNLKIFKALLES